MSKPISKLIHNLESYILAQVNLELARDFGNTILEKQFFDNRVLLEGSELIINKALSISFCITYSTPFSANNNKISFIGDKIIKHLSPDAKDIHDKAIVYRNKMFAHNDSINYSAGLNHFNGGLFPSYELPKEMWFGFDKDFVESIIQNIDEILITVYCETERLKEKIESKLNR